jgi:hypothetical protein
MVVHPGGGVMVVALPPEAVTWATRRSPGAVPAGLATPSALSRVPEAAVATLCTTMGAEVVSAREVMQLYTRRRQTTSIPVASIQQNAKMETSATTPLKIIVGHKPSPRQLPLEIDCEASRRSMRPAIAAVNRQMMFRRVGRATTYRNRAAPGATVSVAVRGRAGRVSVVKTVSDTTTAHATAPTAKYGRLPRNLIF